MNRRTRLNGIRRAAMVPAAALLLAACGGGGGGNTDAAPQSLDEQVGFELSDSSDKERKVESDIQACMEAQGFEYVAVDPAARRAALLGATGVSEAEFEDQFGYGITTLYEQRRQQAAGEANAKIRSDLGESEQAAYDRALRGDNLEAAFEDAVISGDFTRLGGCTKDAAEKVYGGGELLQSLQTGLEELETRVLADPKMVKAVNAWSACMRKEGFELATPEDLDVTLKRKLNDVVGSEPLAATDPNAPPAYDKAALEALQQEEVKMVTADISCEEQHLEAVEKDVREQYEQEFRDQNVDLLSKVPPA